MESSKISAPDPLVRRDVIANALRINPQTVSLWARRYPDFPVTRLPGLNKYRLGQVEAWLENLPRRVGHNIKKEGAGPP